MMTRRTGDQTVKTALQGMVLNSKLKVTTACVFLNSYLATRLALRQKYRTVSTMHFLPGSSSVTLGNSDSSSSTGCGSNRGLLLTGLEQQEEQSRELRLGTVSSMKRSMICAGKTAYFSARSRITVQMVQVDCYHAGRIPSGRQT
jgi:hypothetical protein